MVGLFTAVNLLICITNLQKGNKLCTVAYIYFDHRVISSCNVYQEYRSSKYTLENNTADKRK